MRWLALAVFAWLALMVGRGQTIFFDGPIREAMHREAAPAWTLAMETFTFVGAPRVCLPLIAILGALAWRTHRSDVIRLGTVLAGAVVLDVGLKLVFHRERPAAFFGLHDPDSYSFPSGHALYAACLYGGLASLANWRRVVVWGAAGLMIGLIGLSRIYLGVHYPSDVLAGWSIGWFWTRSVVARKV